MSTISHRELRNNSGDVLRRVAAGESFIVTNGGEEVAHLSPVQRSTLDELAERGQLRRASTSTAALRTIARVTLPDGATTAELIADLRGEDRAY